MIAWRQFLRDKACARAYRPARPNLELLEDRSLLSSGFVQIDLASDVPGMARVFDPNLVNPWGISFSPTGPFWFSENGSGVSDLLDGRGSLLPLTVNIPSNWPGPGSPTGTVFNGGSGFAIAENGRWDPSTFLFAGEDGTISGWNAHVDPTHSLLAIDNSATGAAYKGLALARGADGGTYLYAADFGLGTIDVFDQDFHPVARFGNFEDPSIPSGYAPFNVQNIRGQLYVTYAQRVPGWTDDVPGSGHGFIDVFQTNGQLVRRFASQGVLDSPWGLAVAPNDFGPFSGDLLVGNSGDGEINAFDPKTGAFVGTLTDSSGDVITVPHLWGLSFGNGHLAGAADALFFTAGVNDEQDGLFGAVQFSLAGRPGSTAGDGIFNPNAPGESEDYPLPPDNGPTLQGNASAARPAVLLLPLGDSGVILAPTLTSESSHGSNTEASGTGSSSGASVLGAVNSAGSTAVVVQASTPISADPRFLPVVPSDALDLNSFLDLNPLRSSSTEWTREPSGVIGTSSAVLQASRVTNLPARSNTKVGGPLLRTVVPHWTAGEGVRSKEDRALAGGLEDLGLEAISGQADSSAPRGDETNDKSLVGSLRKLAAPVLIVLFWHGVQRWLTKGEPVGERGRDDHRSKTLVLSRASAVAPRLADSCTPMAPNE
jgi:uncharacterized protein (TIGR03118 family)